MQMIIFGGWYFSWKCPLCCKNVYATFKKKHSNSKIVFELSEGLAKHKLSVHMSFAYLRNPTYFLKIEYSVVSMFIYIQINT